MNKQRGVSLSALLLVCALLGVGALLGMKVGPAYIEYAQIKKAVASIGASGATAGSVADIRQAFGRRAQVDNIESITGQDLEISKDRGQVVVSFAYPKKIPLFGNISLLIEFSGSSATQ